MSDWAKREIELAIEKEHPGYDESKDGFDYGVACYKSALKAYESLSQDNHSGQSWSITRNILYRLMSNKPLTPITDKDFECVVADSLLSEKHVSIYQCPRMSSLFKYVHDDGVVTYSDSNRVVAYYVDKENLGGFGCGLVTRLINRMFPISLPYMPCIDPFKVYCQDFLSDVKNGDFDHFGILYAISPEGERIEINKFYDLTEDKEKEISKEEFYSRKEKAVKWFKSQG